VILKSVCGGRRRRLVSRREEDSYRMKVIDGDFNGHGRARRKALANEFIACSM
jgi:hypothetical protein